MLADANTIEKTELIRTSSVGRTAQHRDSGLDAGSPGSKGGAAGWTSTLTPEASISVSGMPVGITEASRYGDLLAWPAHLRGRQTSATPQPFERSAVSLFRVVLHLW